MARNNASSEPAKGRRRLGRGLQSLMAKPVAVDVDGDAAATATDAGGIDEIPAPEQSTNQSAVDRDAGEPPRRSSVVSVRPDDQTATPSSPPSSPPESPPKSSRTASSSAVADAPRPTAGSVPAADASIVAAPTATVLADLATRESQPMTAEQARGQFAAAIPAESGGVRPQAGQGGSGNGAAPVDFGSGRVSASSASSASPASPASSGPSASSSAGSSVNSSRSSDSPDSNSGRDRSTDGTRDAGSDAPLEAGGVDHVSLLSLPLNRIHANPDQPRRHFDEDAIAALAESIRSAGLMQPIVVRPIADRQGHYEIVAGERRFRAATSIALPRIPAVVHEIDDRTAAEWALVENLQREDLNPIERADAFDRLRSEFGLTHQEIADAVGLDRASVSNHLRLRGLDPETLDQVRSGELGMGHARALLAVEDYATRQSIAREVIDRGMSVRAVERRVRSVVADVVGTEGNGLSGASTGETAKVGIPDATRLHMDDMERRLGEHLGTRVRIVTGREKGTGELRLRFFSFEDFEGLLDRLDFKVE